VVSSALNTGISPLARRSLVSPNATSLAPLPVISAGLIEVESRVISFERVNQRRVLNSMRARGGR
jgi:hypothetical protein